MSLHVETVASLAIGALPEHRANFVAYIKRQREQQIARYLNAMFKTERASARSAALHYSLMLRRMA